MFSFESVLLALVLALVIDRLFGDPHRLYRMLPHPVVLIGRLISRLERRSLDTTASAETLYRRGRSMTLIVVGASALIGLMLQAFFLYVPYGWIPLGALMSSLLAQKSLADHVGAVADGLDQGLDEGRRSVAEIVGRDPETLDGHGVARAAVESLAENFSDGVVAPVFWGVLFGLPGMLAYKAVNTADSMIGYRSERYLHFGRFAARLDDVVNWPPARLAGLLIVIAAILMPGAHVIGAWQAMVQHARHHRSPNAGWPEAAMAGALDFRLAGPRQYEGQMTEDRWIGDGNPDLMPTDIRLAVRLFWWSCGFLAMLVLLPLVAA